jgi:hypothetical protein
MALYDPDFQVWADTWTAGQLPSDVISRLLEEERAHAAQFMTDYGRYAAHFEAVYSAYVRLLDDVNFIDKAGWPTHRGVQYVLLSYNAKTFYSAFDRLLRGHYEDCITLTRGLYETFVRAVWASAYRDNAHNVLVSKLPPGEPAFNLTNFLRDHLHLEWETSYGVFSAFAHSNGFLTLQSLVRLAEPDHEPERFDVHVTFDKRLAETAMPLLTFALLTHLRFTLELLVGDMPVPNEGRLETAREASAFFTRMVSELPSPYWRRVASDLDAIFEMLAMADRGEDWRVWLSHRDRPS